MRIRTRAVAHMVAVRGARSRTAAEGERIVARRKLVAGDEVRIVAGRNHAAAQPGRIVDQGGKTAEGKGLPRGLRPRPRGARGISCPCGFCNLCRRSRRACLRGSNGLLGARGC